MDIQKKLNKYLNDIKIIIKYIIIYNENRENSIHTQTRTKKYENNIKYHIKQAFFCENEQSNIFL